MATQHARERITFGKPLAERQAIQWMLADSATELALARAFVYETLRRLHAGEDTGSAPSMCKLAASEMVGRVADRAVQIHGGMGLVRGFPVERFRSEEHTSDLKSLMRISYAVFCLKKKNKPKPP